MARSTKELAIGKTDYKLTTLGATKGAELWLDLLKIVVAPLETLAKAATTGDDIAIAEAIASALRSLDHATTNKLYAAFGPVTKIRVGDNWPTLEGAVFDDHFAGNYIEMTEWLVQSVAFNFLGFFGDGALDGLVGRLHRMMPSSSASTT